MEQRKGLGRGLASLIPVRREPPPVVTTLGGGGEGRGYRLLALSDIIPNPSQPRKFFDQKKIDELAASIREKGILQPLIVTKKEGRYELISGERRFRAARLVGLQQVPVVIREADASEILELALIENIQRQDLDPVEEAAAYYDLMDRFQYTQEQVAQKVGRDRTTIANTLRLLRLPTKIKQLLQTGSLTEGHARALLGLTEIEKQLYFAGRIAEEGWSVRELEKRITAQPSAVKQKRRELHPVSQKVIQLLDGLRRRLGTQVRVVSSGKKGKIIIEYYSEVDLDRIGQALVR